MLSLWQLFQTLNNFLNSPEFVARKEQVADIMIAVGQWLKGQHPIPFGAADEAAAEIELDDTIVQVTTFIESQGANIPMMAADGDRRERLLELLKVAVPLLLKLLA